MDTIHRIFKIWTARVTNGEVSRRMDRARDTDCNKEKEDCIPGTHNARREIPTAAADY